MHSSLIDNVLNLYQSGRTVDAYKLLQNLKNLQPWSAFDHNIAGVIAHELGRFDEAVLNYKRAIQIDPVNADAYFNLGIAQRSLGHLPESIDSYVRALELSGDDADVLLNLGIVLREVGQLTQAAACFHKLVRLRPENPSAHTMLGIVLRSLERIEEAIQSFQQALHCESNTIDAYYELCQIYEVTNQAKKLRETIVDAKLHCNPGSIEIAICDAQILIRDQQFQAARDVLEAISDSEGADPAVKSMYFYVRGQVYDHLYESDLAFDSFSNANALAQLPHSATDSMHYIEHIDRLSVLFSAEWVSTWQEVELDLADRPDPVFLVGFPRSGTTLLDTMLRGHREVNVVEERLGVATMYKEFKNLGGAAEQDLPKLGGDEITQLRSAYFREIGVYIDEKDKGKIIIDKLPLNMAHAGFINRIFPNSPFLFVQRHPCDCVLSCFMQNFKINNAMSNFLNIKDTANLYNKIMNLWHNYQILLHLNTHTVRYEELINDPRTSLENVLQFLKIDWEEKVLEHQQSASLRKHIRTPSYSQVRQPLYGHANGRWRRYQSHLKPVLPVLTPWIRRFGYDV